MNELPDSWFIPVAINSHLSDCVWFDKKYENLLEEVELKIKKLFNVCDLKISNDNIRFSSLGIVSNVESRPFIDYGMWPEFLNLPRLKTERFCDPYSFHYGASRGAILYPIQFKGIGRNYMANRLDWLHSWGGMTINEAVQELILEKALNNYFPETSVPILALCKYSELEQCFIIRSCDYVRCEQILPQMKSLDKKKMIGRLENFFGNSEKRNWYNIICEKFFLLMKNGFFHCYPTFENISIDGRLLDHHGIDRIINTSEFPYLTKITFYRKFTQNISTEDIYKLIKEENIIKFKSSLNSVLSQCLAVKRAFDILDINTLSEEELKIKLYQDWGESNLPVFDENLLHSNRKTLINLLETPGFNWQISQDGSLIISNGQSLREKISKAIRKSFNLIKQTKSSISSKDILEVLEIVSVSELGENLFAAGN